MVFKISPVQQQVAYLKHKIGDIEKADKGRSPSICLWAQEAVQTTGLASRIADTVVMLSGLPIGRQQDPPGLLSWQHGRIVRQTRPVQLYLRLAAETPKTLYWTVRDSHHGSLVFPHDRRYFPCTAVWTSISYCLSEKRRVGMCMPYGTGWSPVVTNRKNGALGIDLNTDHILYQDWCICNPTEAWNIPMLLFDKSKNQIEAQLGDAVASLCNTPRTIWFQYYRGHRSWQEEGRTKQ